MTGIPPMKRTAVISDDGAYRYLLTRQWSSRVPSITWVMLNPSTANAEKDDQTIRKCIGFTKRWGWGGIKVVNLFALRATYPRDLVGRCDPVGPLNAGYVRDAVRDSPMTIAAWGASIPRGLSVVVPDLGNSFCLGRTKKDHPRHPCMLPYDTMLEEW